MNGWNFEEEKTQWMEFIDSIARVACVGCSILGLIIFFVTILTLCAGFMPEYGGPHGY